MAISPESQYVLDGMVELLELPYDVIDFTYAHNLDVDWIIDSVDLSMQKQLLYDTYMDWRKTVSPAAKAYCSLSNLFSSRQQIQDLYTTVTHEMLSNYINSQGFSVMHQLFPMVVQRETEISKPANIEYILMHRKLNDWPVMFKHGIERAVADYSETTVDDVLAYERSLGAGFEENQIRDYLNRSTKDYGLSSLPNPYSNIKSLHYMRPQQIRAGKKAVKKSAELFKKHLGTETLNMFLSGQQIRFEGQYYNYLFKKSTFNHSLVHQAVKPVNSVPYDFFLEDKSGVLLGSMCVYFAATPVMDQIVAMTMMIKHGGEYEILKSANFFSTTSAYDTDERMQAIREEKRAKYHRKTQTQPATTEVEHDNDQNGFVVEDGRIRLKTEKEQRAERLRRALGSFPKEQYDALKQEHESCIKQQIRNFIGLPDKVMDFVETSKHTKAELLNNSSGLAHKIELLT